jgi:hypothetical protein
MASPAADQKQPVMRAVVAERYAPDHKWAPALRVGEFPAPALPDASSVRVRCAAAAGCRRQAAVRAHERTTHTHACAQLRVTAASINPVDYKILLGNLALATSLGKVRGIWRHGRGLATGEWPVLAERVRQRARGRWAGRRRTCRASTCPAWWSRWAPTASGCAWATACGP